MRQAAGSRPAGGRRRTRVKCPVRPGDPAAGSEALNSMPITTVSRAVAIGKPSHSKPHAYISRTITITSRRCSVRRGGHPRYPDGAAAALPSRAASGRQCRRERAWPHGFIAVFAVDLPRRTCRQCRAAAISRQNAIAHSASGYFAKPKAFACSR